MTTNSIYLDLAAANTWIGDDNTDSTINGPFEQKRANLPKVLWSLNAIPFEGGVKSLTPRTPPDITSIPDLSESNSPSSAELELLLDVNGDSVYMFTDSLPSDTFINTAIWLYGSPTGAQWNKLLDINTVQDFIKLSTVFQTQTLHVLGAFDSFGSGVNVSGDGQSISQVFSYDSTTNTAEIYRLTGINFADNSFKLLGITSYQNYLIFWSKEGIFYSSPTDFTNFSPAVGGGGFTRISEAKGNILFIVPNPEGLVVYCEKNIVHAAFSGDAANPWVFTEIAGGGGLLRYAGHKQLVTGDETRAVQVAMTDQGLLLVTTNSAQPMPPEINLLASDLTLEYKELGTVEFERTVTRATNVISQTTKLRNIQIHNTILFLTVDVYNIAESGSYPYTSVMYMFNLQTNQVAQLQGRYLSVTKTLRNGKVIPNNFLAVIRSGDLGTSLAPVQLNVAQGTDREWNSVMLGMRDSEILIGNIQISRHKTTIVHSVRLDGRIESDDLTSGKVRVFLYSKATLGASAPQEFMYNPDTDTYYGYAEGKDLVMELRGKNFYLTGASIEVEVGGDF